MMGNLGNQMFIYAMARAIQLEYNQSLTIDKAGLKRGYYSAKYRLDSFNIPENINYDLDRIIFWSKLKYLLTSKIFHLQYGIIRRIKSDLIVPSFITKSWFRLGCYYNVNRQHYNYPVTNKSNLYIYGYFQSEKYFDKYKEIILKDFEFKYPPTNSSVKYIEQITNCNAVAVSIRACKNPENPKVNDNINLGMIDKDYYYNGMRKIAKRVEKPKFFIFADNIDIVKADYEFPFPVTYILPDNAVEGLRIMTHCKHFVLSNSTFSWWGGYLSRNPNKEIIMPEVWDRHGPARQDIYFGKPIKLPVEFLTK